jgi:hypothetical protein
VCPAGARAPRAVAVAAARGWWLGDCGSTELRLEIESGQKKIAVEENRGRGEGEKEQRRPTDGSHLSYR